jgi:ferritin-like metal-binding protein YciE
MKTTTTPITQKSSGSAAGGSTGSVDKSANASAKTTTTSSSDQQAKASDHQPKEKDSQPSMLETFFIAQLNDIYDAEKQLVKALPQMQAAATTEELEAAFEKHALETQRHVSRLEKIFKQLGKTPESKTCEVMKALIKEGTEVINETKEGTMARDAALIMAAQRVEHYEIATYGALVQFAITMELDKVANMLEDTLDEEEETDSDLTDIAEEFINLEADGEQQYSWQSEAETE